MNDITIIRQTSPLRDQLALSAGEKDTESRLHLFADWLDATGGQWHDPDLAGWRDDLLASGMQPSSVQAYLSTVRGVYRKILRSNRVRDQLFAQIASEQSVGDRKAFVDELLARLANAVHPDTAPVSVTKVQDVADHQALRLTTDQAEALLYAPSLESLAGLRDAAVIAMLLCAGVREDELCSIRVEDLRRRYGRELALLIPEGKGNKQRMVVYGDLRWCLDYADKWMKYAGIASGFVFRGLYNTGRHVRPTRLTTRAVQNILKHYPVDIDGELKIVRPHDCRRTYARLQYEAGAELIAIQQNLGHADLQTTLRYIGKLDAGARRAIGVIRSRIESETTIKGYGE